MTYHYHITYLIYFLFYSNNIIVQETTTT